MIESEKHSEILNRKTHLIPSLIQIFSRIISHFQVDFISNFRDYLEECWCLTLKFPPHTKNMTNKIIEKGVVLLKRRSLIATSAKLKHGSLAIKACFASPMYTIVKFELWHESTVFIISNMLQWNQRIWIVFHTSFHSTRIHDGSSNGGGGASAVCVCVDV